MYQLIIDDREHKIKPYLKRIENSYPFIDFIYKRITVGDYCISYGGQILFLIERKTWSDLSSSIRDGRKNNVKKLLELKKEHPQIIIFYLIEGKSRYTPSTKICRVPFKNLQSHLDHLVMRDGIQVIFSKNNEDTAFRLVELIKNFTTLSTQVIKTFVSSKEDNDNKTDINENRKKDSKEGGVQ
jgi:ERCC4-type nuclease